MTLDISPPTLVLSFVVGIGVIVLMIVARSLARRRQRRHVSEAFRLVGGKHVQWQGSIATGEIDGHFLEVVAFEGNVDGGGGTKAWAAVPAGAPRAQIHVAPASAGAPSAASAGSFDACFSLECAPEHVARAIVDQRARDLMLVLHPCEVNIENGDINVSAMDRGDVRRASSVLRLTAHLATRLSAARIEVQAARVESAREGEVGYRGATPGQLARVDDADGHREILSFRLARGRRQRERERKDLRGFIIVGVVLLTGGLILLLLSKMKP